MNKSDAIAHFGTQAKLGEILKISQAAVSKWPDLVPEKQALKLSRITAGALVYHPEVYNSPDLKISTHTVLQEIAA